MSRDHMFLTGCYRSGTTLLEKLLHGHQAMCVASQPFPILYHLAKERFLEERRLIRRYPLDHMFLEHDYSLEDLSSFLATFRVTEDDLDNLFQRLTRYSRGLWTPEVLRFRSLVKTGLFLDVQEQLHDLLPETLSKEAAQIVGSKEILCEEFAPFLLSSGWRVALIVRDPRAMIASLSFGSRDNLTGSHRPILYSLRLWRKTVAVILAFQSEPSLTWMRYEDLVEGPARTLNATTEWLGIGPYPANAFEDGIHAQDGTVWRGNSSFRDQSGVSTTSVAEPIALMPASTRRYIEMVCAPEMRVLGYEPSDDEAVDEDFLLGFQEPVRNVHELFPTDYSSSPGRVENEVRRLQILGGNETLGLSEARAWFLHERAYEGLAAAR